MYGASLIFRIISYLLVLLKIWFDGTSVRRKSFVCALTNILFSSKLFSGLSLEMLKSGNFNEVVKKITKLIPWIIAPVAESIQGLFLSNFGFQFLIH
jgi:hypothetical protein